MPQNYADAMQRFTIASDAGWSAAMFNIGHMHENGLGVPRNNDMAITWYKKASAAGSKQAKEKLAKLGVSE
jgi:uncharacterized protein